MRNGAPSPFTAPLSDRRSTGFLLVFALAYVGGVVGYLPLLTLLLPIKVDAVAGAGRLGVLTAIVVAGALAASVSNIVFGWLSDRAVTRGGGRRAWLAGGLVATMLSYAAIAATTSAMGLVLAVVAFQVAVNALLAPLLAIMADEVPDAQRAWRAACWRWRAQLPRRSPPRLWRLRCLATARGWRSSRLRSPAARYPCFSRARSW
ncbi:hypothetical protein QP162_15420 [Sphingomonas aurantiaca]|uniref:hypothetical protein n=1 Tax=Sphingomonas aurantiaca TaxID=185949 RepID=UPI002FDF9C8F